ncbi:MAG: hypothetical protein ACOCUN_00475 [Jiangellaceae bacterium]
METIKLLFVCTAGRCRSPIAAALFEKHLEQPRQQVTVRSVGVEYTGEPTPSIGISLLEELGIHLPSNRSTQLTTGLVDDADLVLGMTREHVRDVLELSADAWPKTFTLKEFARRVGEAAPRRRHQRLDDWLASLSEDRETYDLFSSESDDDLMDPFGQRTKVWRQVISEVDELMDKIVPALGLAQAKPPNVVRIRRLSEVSQRETPHEAPQEQDDERQLPGRINIAR